MTRSRGFTLIELMLVVALVGILAVIAIPTIRAGRRNATVAAVATGLQFRLEQLQFTALSEQQEHVLVVVDVPGNDAGQCGSIFSSGCGRVFDLRAPTRRSTRTAPRRCRERRRRRARAPAARRAR